MKKFLKSAVALCFGVLAMAACTQKMTITPSFPESVTDSDVTGQKTVTFEANQDWELSVPQETISYFWIEGKGGNRLNKISGKAGSYTITIGVTEFLDFEEHVCNVTLKMGGESKVIATYTLAKAEKILKVFAGEVVDGNLVYKGEGGFAYEEDSTSTVSLVYASPYDFVRPILISSRLSYDIETTGWVTIDKNANVMLGRPNDSEVRLSIDNSKLSADNLSDASVIFKVRGTDEVVTSITVELPNLDDFRDCSHENESIFFTAEGQYTNGMITLDTCRVTVSYAGKKTLVLAGVDKDGYWMASSHNDYSYTYGSLTLNDAKDAYIKIDESYSLTMEENTGAARVAYLLLIPNDKLNFVSGETGFKFNQWISNAGANEKLPEEAEAYVIAQVDQDGVGGSGEEEEELITIVDGDATLGEMTSDHEMYAAISTVTGLTDIFVVTATSRFSFATDKEIWGINSFTEIGEPSETIFSFEPVNGNWQVDASENVVSGFFILSTGEELTPFAAVWVDFNKSEEAPFSFVYPEYVTGASLEEFIATEENPAPVVFPGAVYYTLTYTTTSPSMAMINVPSMPLWGAAYENADSSPTYWLTHEQTDEEGKQMLVNMNTDEANKKDCFLFGASITDVRYVLICTYKPTEE